MNPHNAAAFAYLGHYYSRFTADSQRALKCYERAITLNPDDSESGESLCDMLDHSGKETLEQAVCGEASEKSPRAFWAFRRLGYLHLHHRRWSEAVQSLQHAIRGYPTCADLWEVSIFSDYLVLPSPTHPAPALKESLMFCLIFLLLSFFLSFFPFYIGSGSSLPATWHVYCCY